MNLYPQFTTVDCIQKYSFFYNSVQIVKFLYIPQHRLTHSISSIANAITFAQINYEVSYSHCSNIRT